MIFEVLTSGPGGVLPIITGYRERKNNMSELTSEQKEHYLDQADKHADFLAEKVFKPAFAMAFIHGVKHGREDLAKELKVAVELKLKKERMKAELNNSPNKR